MSVTGEELECFSPKIVLNRTPPQTGDKRQREDTPTKLDEDRLKKGREETGTGRGLSSDNEKLTEEDENGEDAKLIEKRELREAAETRRKEKEERESEQEEIRKRTEEENRKKEMEKQLKELEKKIECENASVEKLSTKLREEAKIIRKSVSKEAGGKISFRREDQHNVREATTNILCVALELVGRVRKAEQELHTHQILAIQEGQQEETLGNDAWRNRIEGLLETNCNMVRFTVDKMVEMEIKMNDLFKNQKVQRDEERGRHTGQRARRSVRRGEGGIDSDTTHTMTDNASADDSDTDANNTTETKRTAVDKTKNLSYADKVKTSKTTTTESGPWTTPERRTNYETIITTDKEPEKLMKRLTENVKAKDLGGPPVNVARLKSGALVLKWRDEAHRRQATGKLTEIVKDINVKDSRSLNPSFMLTGVPDDYTGEEIIQQMLVENEDLEKYKDRKHEIKILSKIPCRNAWKKNWIFQAPADIFKAFVKKGKVHFNLEELYIEEYVGLAICYNCLRFGHVAKHCRQETACGKCSGPHDTKGCVANKIECINCKRLGKTNRDHNARDKDCPAFAMKMRQVRNKIAYGS